MNLKDMECFIEVCRKKSITSAAESLYLSPQAVSKTIRRIEDEIGAELLLRSSKGVELTEYGTIFYEHACGILTDYEGMAASIHDLKKQEKGSIRLVSAFGILRLLSPDFIHAFLAHYPNMQMTYMEFPDIYVLENVKNGNYDIGFLPYIQKDPELEYYPLFSREIYFITHKESQFYNRSSVSVHDISKEPVIIENENFMIHHIFEETCKKEGINPDIYFNTSGFSLCYKLCKTHEGNTFSMDFIFDDMKSDDLQRIPLLEKPMWNIAAVRKKEIPMTDSIRRFLHFSTEWCRTV